MKFDLLFRRRWWLFYGPIMGLAAFLLVLSYHVWLPQPPRNVKIVAGQSGDGITGLALRYRDRLSQMGISAEVLTHTSAHDALQSLASDTSESSFAIASGLQAGRSGSPAQLQALAVIEREPLWIFSRNALITRMQDLRGLRVGIASDDALAESVAMLVLQTSQIKVEDVQIIKIPRQQLANQLIDSKIDAAIMLASATSEPVRVLTRSSAVQIIGLDQVRKLVQREPRLRPFVLPQGVIELRGDIPPRDLTMVAADLQLVIQPGMHLALQRALLDVANQLHERPNFLQRQGEFPRVTDMDFPASVAALESFRGNRPWLEQLLPYGWAQLTQWLLLAGLPIVLFTGLLLTWIPTWFDWRANAVLQNFYGELKFLETEIEPVASERPIEIKRLMQRLDEIDLQVMQLELPTPYAERWYTLRSHLADARERLLALRSR